MKFKTKRSVAKRVKITASGLLKTRKANKSHLLAKKTSKRKRHLSKPRVLEGRFARNFKIMLGGVN